MTITSGFVTVLSLLSLAQTPATPPTAQPPPPAPNVDSGVPAPKPVPVPKSPAELIADTRASIKQGEEVVAKLQLELDSPDSEYKSAETDFETLNQKLKDAKLQAGKLAKEGKAEEAQAADAAATVIEKDWVLARERFDIAIQKRMARREAITNLKERITADHKRLTDLEGTGTGTTPEVTPAPRPTTPALPE